MSIKPTTNDSLILAAVGLAASGNDGVTTDSGLTPNTVVPSNIYIPFHFSTGIMSTETGPPVNESIVSPTKIYTICNDLNKTSNGFLSNNYSIVLYSDHFFNFTTKRRSYFTSNNQHFRPIFSPISDDNTIYNNGVDLFNETISDSLMGETLNNTSFTFSHYSLLSSSVKTKFPKVLCIGDSVTDGFGSTNPISITTSNPAQYWSYIKKMNLMYQTQNSGGFSYLSIGKNSSRSFLYNGLNYKVYAEGRGGWTTNNYLTTQSTLGFTNYFYDASKSGSIKFSLNYYINNWRTLLDDGITRATVGSTAGIQVTDNTIGDVCTPTHVVIQLGFNDVSANYQSDIVSLIANIKAEFPNMIIIISIIDAAGTYYPELYPNINSSSINYLGNGLHSKMWGLVNFVQGLESPSTRVYTCLNYFIQPTGFGVQTRDISYPEAIANPQFQMGQAFGAGYQYHANTYAHASWAYHLDCLIKYTSYLYL